MGNLLFSPNGRVGPQAFLKGLGIIALLSALISMVPAFNFSLGTILTYASIVLLFPIFCLLIKRSHDGGKSGWMSIVWFILIMILGFAATAFAQNMTGGQPLQEMNELVRAAMAEQDLRAVGEIGKEYAPAVAKNAAIPASIAGFVATMLGGFLVNLFVKQDAHENQFGDIPA